MKLQNRQYGYRKNAFRAIRNYEQVNPTSKIKFAVNQLDEGCFEILCF